MLETNGTLIGPLRQALPWLAYLSIDVKLESVDGEQVSLEKQRRFLGTSAAAGVATWVKIVIGATTDPVEFDAAMAMVVEVAEERSEDGRGAIEVFLQPVTPFGSVTAAPTPDRSSHSTTGRSAPTRGSGWSLRPTRRSVNLSPRTAARPVRVGRRTDRRPAVVTGLDPSHGRLLALLGHLGCRGLAIHNFLERGPRRDLRALRGLDGDRLAGLRVASAASSALDPIKGQKSGDDHLFTFGHVGHHDILESGQDG